MTPTTNHEDSHRSSEDIRAIADRVDDLSLCIAHLAEIVQGLFDRSGRPIGHARPSRSAYIATEAQDEGLSRRVDQLRRRCGDQERRSADIAARIDGHDRLLRMLCLAVKELEDPYGFGQSLDERIGADNPFPDGDDGDIP